MINEEDLYEALKNKKIGFAALDVYKNEPLKNSKLTDLENKYLHTCCAIIKIKALIRDILIENIPEINSFNLITAGINDNIENIYAKEKNNLCLVIGSVDPEFNYTLLLVL